MWLLRKLTPDFKTIADFRRDNGAAIAGACRAFVILCRDAGLFSARLIVVDGSKFRAVANGKKIARREAIAQEVARLDGRIGAYLAGLDEVDATEFDDRKDAVPAALMPAPARQTDRGVRTGQPRRQHQRHHPLITKEAPDQPELPIVSTQPDEAGAFSWSARVRERSRCFSPPRS